MLEYKYLFSSSWLTISTELFTSIKGLASEQLKYEGYKFSKSKQLNPE